MKLTPKKQKLLTTWAKVEEQLPAGQKNVLTDAIKLMIDEFLCHSDISYTLLGRNNQFYMGKVNGKSQFSPKQYLLQSFPCENHYKCCKKLTSRLWPVLFILTYFISHTYTLLLENKKLL